MFYFLEKFIFVLSCWASLNWRTFVAEYSVIRRVLRACATHFGHVVSYFGGLGAMLLVMCFQIVPYLLIKLYGNVRHR